MSIATNQSLLQGSRGKVGNFLTREVNGKTIISSLPNPDAPQTVLQKSNRRQFREASAFAQVVMRDPGIKAYFQHEAKRRRLPNAYTAALSFKLKDLKTPAEEKDQTPEAKEVVNSPAEIREQQGGDVVLAEDVKQFRKLYRDFLDPLIEALNSVSHAWSNLERLSLDKTQKEVIQVAVRLQIQQTLMSIHLRSTANATEFKHPTPNFEHIAEVVNKALNQ